MGYCILCFKLVLWPLRRSSSAETIVLLRNSFHLSASSRRFEDVEMLRVALFTERGRCWEYSWDYKLSIHFVLHE